jgi:hypothetical protein
MSTTNLRVFVRGHHYAVSLLTILRIALSLAVIICAAQLSAQSAPALISEANSTRAIALESVTLRREPFQPTQPILFGVDSRTRIMLFARNLDLLPGEDATAVRAEAEDAARALSFNGRVRRPCPWI